MKKVLTALMALVMILSLVTCSFAEDESTVGAVITFETEDTVQGIDAPEIPAGTLSADVFGFDSNQVYAVYSAPDVKSIRGAGGNPRSARTTGCRCLAAKVTGFWFSMT